MSCRVCQVLVIKTSEQIGCAGLLMRIVLLYAHVLSMTLDYVTVPQHVGVYYAMGESRT